MERIFALFWRKATIYGGQGCELSPHVGEKVEKMSKIKHLNKTLTAESGATPEVKVKESNSDGFTERMRRLVSGVGSVAKLARNCGISESTVKNWVDGVADPSRARCLALARGTGASLLWLVSGEGPMWAKDVNSAAAGDSQSQVLSQESLTIAVQLAIEAVEERRGTLPPSQMAELIAIIYELLVDGLPEAKILRLARASAMEER